MPIQLTKFDYLDLCYGYKWEITDINKLAHLIAKIALGQHRHAKKIIEGSSSNIKYKPPLGNAIDLLTVPENSDPWHRDGWLFQAISWIVANKIYQDSLILHPHMIHADKGFDGLHITIKDKKITDITIYEDKATENPRKTIKDLVWPEFQEFEQGSRDNVLLAEITPLLEGQRDLDIDEAIASIIWSDLRHYRVSITIGDTHNKEAYHKNLFDGYEDITKEHIKRKAETIYIQDLRESMKDLADKVIEEINKIV